MEDASQNVLKTKRKTEPYYSKDLAGGRGSSEVVELYEGRFLTIPYN